MNIHKSRFLLVTGLLTLSGLAVMVGCSSKSDDAGPTPHEEPTKPPVDQSKETPDPGASSSGGTNPAPTPTNTPDSGKTPDGGGTKDGGEGGAAAACLDDSTPAAQPACPGNGECQFACDEFVGTYKKGLSADIRKCLTVAICGAGTATCVDKALAKSCADPTAAAFCTPLVNGCKAAFPADTITQASCEGVAKGLNQVGRQTFKTCMETQNDCGDCVPMMK